MRGFVSGCELPRRDFTALRDRLGLQPGSPAWLRARRVTRFKAAGASPGALPAGAAASL